MIIQKNGIIRNISENRWPEYKAKGYEPASKAVEKPSKMPSKRGDGMSAKR